MKKIIVIIAVLLSCTAFAQVSKVSLQASGLTCSMCSNSINKALKTLDFVENVEPNISNSSFDITIRSGSNADFDKIKKKVEDAGFFVAKFIATVNFNDVAIANDHHVKVGGTVFHFLNSKEQVLNGQKTIRVLDKGYVSAKEFKKNGGYTKMECYKTGVAGGCCLKDGLDKGTRIFHVTI